MARVNLRFLPKIEPQSGIRDLDHQLDGRERHEALAARFAGQDDVGLGQIDGGHLDGHLRQHGQRRL